MYQISIVCSSQLDGYVSKEVLLGAFKGVYV
jgi:hypothetical protein